MEGDGSDISAIMQTRSGGDLASRGFLLSAIEHQDRQLFNRYAALRRHVAERKKRQDDLVIQVAMLVRSEEKESGELRQTRQDKREVLEGLEAKQGELQEMLHQFEEDEAEIGSEIQEYMRRSAAGRGGQVLPMFTGRFSRPINGPITSPFGMRYHPILHVYRMHTGIDFGASYGTPIHAAAAGMVIATQEMRGYGRVVILDHGGGISTVYAHTSRFYCSPGQRVERGQIIAAVGATGLATGPHLHFEVRVNGRPVNPLGRL
jgi:murein DD-endopeptidase MepM/ murein hydrolase activator NlpD